ncbi:MAG TPA: tetratricopeptide repeat protein [Candidatus Polarisedimenticolia bacterium]|jgi:regulator of sirC expression with transglutaminase-like and TPR domain|nr:tetratricopeptide repeat protein [Nitrospirales bacterium]HEV8701814.1 tetratricopeptide repeat protein [Candidatus Polarisedimenticolia bacterium]
MVPRIVVGRSVILIAGLSVFIGSDLGSAEPPQGTCIPNCASILDLAGPTAAEELHGLANLVLDRVRAAGSGQGKVEILNQFFFRGLRFQSEDNAEFPEGLLPADVLSRRSGSCVGLAGVYLALASFLDLPVAAVSAPNHVFVRFDDSHARINVELLQAGKALPDDWYVRTHKIPASSIASGVFLRSLGEREFLGNVYANLGTFYSKHGDFNNSRVLYEAALRDAPQLPNASYNLGNDLLSQRLYRQAAKAFDAALTLFPTDVMALNNRGIALCRLGKSRRARKDFQAAVDLDPAFIQAQSNLVKLNCGLTTNPGP